MDAAGSDVVIQAGQVSTKVDINQHNIQLGTIAASLAGACLLLFKGGMLHLSTLSEPCAQAGSLLVHGSQWETVLFSVFVGMAMAIHYMLPKPPAFESLQNEVQSLRAQNAAHMTTIDELTASLDVSQAEQQDSAGENEEMKLKLDEAEGEMVNLEEELALSDNELCVVNAKYAERISELQEVKGDIENLLGATKIGVLYLDQDLRIRKFTEAMTDIAPWTQADIGRSAEQFSYEFTQPMVAACKQVLMQQQQDEWRQEVSHDGKNFMMRVLPHTQTSTNITGVVVTFLDVTEKVLQKRDYLRLIEHANAPIFGIDNKGLINEWNRKSAELTLYSKEDVMGRNLVRTNPPSLPPTPLLRPSSSLPSCSASCALVRSKNLLSLNSRMQCAWFWRGLSGAKKPTTLNSLSPPRRAPGWRCYSTRVRGEMPTKKLSVWLVSVRIFPAARRQKRR
jgi:PAS domain-containing protein